jgi:hypothetical protein
MSSKKPVTIDGKEYASRCEAARDLLGKGKLTKTEIARAVGMTVQTVHRQSCIMAGTYNPKASKGTKTSSVPSKASKGTKASSKGTKAPSKVSKKVSKTKAPSKA